MAIAAAARIANAHGALSNLTKSVHRTADLAPCPAISQALAQGSVISRKQGRQIYHQLAKSHAAFQLAREEPLPRRARFAVSAKQATVAPPATRTDDVTEGLLDCVVVGGGVSGLCTAQALRTEHGDAMPRVLVTEARERVGGNITTVEKDGYLWEEGPNSFQPGVPMLKMIVDSGIKEELVLGDPTAPRFVLWGGRLRPVPAGLTDLPFFDLLSIFGKIRAGLGALGFRPGPPGREESVEEFVRRNLGDEVFERLIEPFCSGVYAGDPSKLSMKAAFGKVQRLEDIGGSIVGGSLKLIKERKANPPPPPDPRLPKPKGQTVGSFKKGLQTLPKAIADILGDTVKVNWKLTAMAKVGNAYELTYSTPEGQKVVKTRTVALTVPAYTASSLLREINLEASDALARFYYPPVGAVTISYPESAVREERLVNGKLNGFGQLHPRSQGVVTLGTIYSSALFPNRAPEGRVLILNYIGGALNPDIVNQSEDELVAQVDKDIRTMLIKPDAPKPLKHGVRVWPKAIPQFTVGHLETLEEARQALKDAGHDGIILGGNYVAGVALGRCVEGAYESAKDIAKAAETADMFV
ncbi:oxygen-dependent protoporphyrinogen oxidase [Klebsormidium nitens]|uniref:Protoporphyrinogen oxidase n=1 Tax=Klebsormidium nitens TaxID=105231 RepID=A0A1Y1HR47_KLENI|nr:oxygen-dependent protoporphyrinogen oxidase [Klebsormidium nitens]|eukprot:GAQ80272.1 oxygen-dependent protoporphyrinogen oxidase [Klebsormidium nitens]